MFQVNKLYHHHSLGVEIEVVLKKIIILEDDVVSKSLLVCTSLLEAFISNVLATSHDA